MNKYKIAIVANIIAPYRIPFFNRINAYDNFEFKVFALAETEGNREWDLNKRAIKFDYKILTGWHRYLTSWEFPIHLNVGLSLELRKYKPDIVVTSGYSAPAYWEALLYSKFLGRKYVLWNGTTLLSSGENKGLIGKMKRLIIKSADRYVTYGSKATEYLEYLGADSSKIYTGCNTVDVEKFYEMSLKYRDSKEFRRKRDNYPDMLLLFVGQLIERKGVHQVLRVLEKLPDQKIGFLIVGNGRKKKRLEKFCQDHSLKNVFFEGYQQRDILPKYYALADLLILPSFEEVWGLVVNEALASGLFVLCSDRCGAAYDLIEEGWNGTLFNPYCEKDIEKEILKAKEKLELLRLRRKEIGKHTCQKFGIDQSAHVFANALTSVLN